MDMVCNNNPDRDRATRVLRKGEKRYFALAAATAQITWTTDREGRVIEPQPHWAAYSGLSDREIAENGWIAAVHPEDVDRFRDDWNKAIKKQSAFDFEFRARRFDGEYRHMSVRGVPILGGEGELEEWIGTFTDITERKEADAAVQKLTAQLEKLALDRQRAEKNMLSYAKRLRAISRRLIEVEETQRMLLARELHDVVGQNLVGLGINLHVLARMLPPRLRAKFATQIEESLSHVEQIGDATRNVMHELRPPLLDEHGLPAALRALAASHAKKTHMQTLVTGDSPHADLPTAVALAMFRIAQEALNNITKHSAADHVEISFTCAHGYATLVVKDDGAGFEPGQIETPRDTSGWGLLLMRERAEAAGAKFAVESSPQHGTKITVDYKTDVCA